MTEAVRLFSAHLWKGRRIDHRKPKGAVLERLEAENSFKLTLKRDDFTDEIYKPTTEDKASKCTKGVFTLELVSGQSFSGCVTKIFPDFDIDNFLNLTSIDIYLQSDSDTGLQRD